MISFQRFRFYRLLRGIRLSAARNDFQRVKYKSAASVIYAYDAPFGAQYFRIDRKRYGVLAVHAAFLIFQIVFFHSSNHLLFDYTIA